MNPLSYFRFKPVLNDWCNKGRGMIEKNNNLFPFSLSLTHTDTYTVCVIVFVCGGGGGGGLPAYWNIHILHTFYLFRHI